MNIFYTPPSYINGQQLELVEQEAKHASKVLRYGEGDEIVVVDGHGGFYEGPIRRIHRNAVVVQVKRRWKDKLPSPDIRVGLSIIKKRDRLEFAVEKAVELGVRTFYLFASRHSEKTRIRTDRLEKIALSAMKQSMRAYKPQIIESTGITQIISHCEGYQPIVAHQEGTEVSDLKDKNENNFLLFIGPEGGFSEEEIDVIVQQEGNSLSLGDKRLRAETAAVVGVTKLSGLNF